MQYRFLLSSPQGDKELTSEYLEQPFLLNPTEKHPFLSLGGYFKAIKSFLLQENSSVLVSALSDYFNLQVKPEDIPEVIIRSEKHGEFYHIASVEISVHERTIKLAVTSALSEQAKKILAHEYEIIQTLVARHTADYLPQLYCIKHITCQADLEKEEILMVLGEWLDSYHEWHLNQDQETGSQNIKLWDYQKGYRYLLDAECHELLRQASYILTVFFDQKSYSQIYPWHHGAGDFVVKVEDGAIAVKLITARNYSPLINLQTGEDSSQLAAIINFLLNLSLRIRLDKLDGVGTPAWIDNFAVQAAVKGFFEALSCKINETQNHNLEPAVLLHVLQAFDPQEFLIMYQPLLEIYSQEDPEDFALVLDKLPAHVNELYRIIHDFEL
jgi:hypothetical protein